MRRLLYQLARLIGDVNAISRGPGAMVHRLVRKIAGRQLWRLWRLLP